MEIFFSSQNKAKTTFFPKGNLRHYSHLQRTVSFTKLVWKPGDSKQPYYKGPALRTSFTIRKATGKNKEKV